jgi:UDPglucose 6-dehydrogenase
MKVSVVGVGYVGLVAAACLADGGNHVVCVDNDEKKINDLRKGRIPIFEPGLAEIVGKNEQAGRLTFTTSLKEGVDNSLVIFLGVGTPSAADGSADISAILSVAAEIADCMDSYRIIVTKSTVPVGTHKQVGDIISSRTEVPFDYVSNPEFLKEGSAVDDFLKPDRVIIGTTNPAVMEIMKQLYAPFMRKSSRILFMDPASAEMTKYAANALLATKISFMNEVAGLCERLGADVEAVRQGVGSDSRIGNAFLFPGVGFGGSCFPKDVSALVSMGEETGHPMSIVEAVQAVNQRQREMFAKRVIEHFGARCSQITLAVWGLAFKAQTDDVRESPAIAGVKMFLEQGMRVRAHDPEAMDEARKELGDGVTMLEDGYDVLDGADALVIFTDWPKFRTPDFDLMAERLPSKLVFDGRNMYDPGLLAKRGFRYICVGRPSHPPA